MARALWTISWLAACALPLQAAPASLPVLRVVGVIPPQEGLLAATSPMAEPLAAFQGEFSAAIRRSQRFRVLDDRLVQAFWTPVSQREVLKKDYELDALLSLNVVPGDDTVKAVVRLLSPDLDILLQESEVYSRSRFQQASAGVLQRSCEDLVFRLINRLPIDVAISSVHGRFLTLAGGHKQGLRQGQAVEIVRAHVASRHPATKSWQEFRSIAIGRARVVEVKERTAIAKLSDQAYEGAIDIGDGVRIAEIAGRVRFQRLANRQDSHEGDAPIIVPPLVAGATDSSGELAAVDSSGSIEGEDEEEDEGERKSTPAPARETATLAGASVASTPVRTAGDIWRRGILSAGIRSWQFERPGASASSRVLWYLPTNFVAIDVPLPWSRKGGPQYRATGQVGSGATAATGRYFTYSARGQAAWRFPLTLFGRNLDHAEAGGKLTLDGLGVNSEPFGGFDRLNAGLFGGLGGSILGKYSWFGRFTVTPLTLGRIGYSGDFKSVASSFGYTLSGGGFWPPSKKKPYQLGAALALDSTKILDTRSQVSTFGGFTVSLLARWKKR